MVISASLHACGVVFPFAMLTSICRSIVTICSGLYLLIGMTCFSSKWILSHSTWYKSRRSGHLTSSAPKPEMSIGGDSVRDCLVSVFKTLHLGADRHDLATSFFGTPQMRRNTSEACR